MSTENQPQDAPPPNNPKTAAMFAPVYATEQEFIDLFKSLGFTNFTKIHVTPNQCGFVQFSTEEELEPFINKLNGYNFKGDKLFCRQAPCGQKNPNKTLYVRIDDPHSKIDERELFFLFAPHGFIRKIKMKGHQFFVEFDKEEDATAVLNQFKRGTFRRYPLKANYTRNPTHTKNVENLSIPLEYIIPNEHPFWRKLQDILETLA